MRLTGYGLGYALAARLTHPSSQVMRALGGAGELVTSPGDFGPALARAVRRGRRT